MYRSIKLALLITLLSIALLPCISQTASAQNVGVSFSFFFPKNGHFSIPISPFSLRGVGVNLNRYVAIESGFSLYRMSGMNVTDVPFETKDPIIGPTTTLLVPLELVLQFAGTSQEFRIKGGGFVFYNFYSRLLNGNLDAALRDYVMWDVLNSNFDYDNNIGWGYQMGVEYIVYITQQFGLTFGASYFVGGADLNLGGSYSGGIDGGIIQSASDTFPESRLDFTGWEISVGALFGN